MPTEIEQAVSEALARERQAQEAKVSAVPLPNPSQAWHKANARQEKQVERAHEEIDRQRKGEAESAQREAKLAPHRDRCAAEVKDAEAERRETRAGLERKIAAGLAKADADCARRCEAAHSKLATTEARL